jgi:hypothetical protein
MTRVLRYRAGAEALRLIRSEGFDPAMVRALAGPASGPKWLVLAPLDQALLEAGLLRREPSAPRLLLVGASAGGWRMLALAAGDPAAVHRALLDAYIGQVFDRHHTPESVSAAYRHMLGEVLPPKARQRILHHPACDVALHVTRVRGPAAASARPLQLAGFAAWAGLNWVSARCAPWFFERVLLHTRPEAFTPAFAGSVVRLDATNLMPAAVATGSVPLYMAPVRDLPGAPPGRYLDGGLADYHLDQRYADSGIVLFPHFQEAILPGWFDRYRPRRRPRPEVLADVLQLHPAPEWVAHLPDGRLPTRDDFLHFIDDPAERIRRWRSAVAAAESLGEALLDDLAAGRIPDLVEPTG